MKKSQLKEMIREELLREGTVYDIKDGYDQMSVLLASLAEEIENAIDDAGDYSEKTITNAKKLVSINKQLKSILDKAITVAKNTQNIEYND